MKKKLTISEISKILDISTHTIRFYNKEGLINPEYDKGNGYRLFDYVDLYKLANIVLLRDSGISVNEIKELLKNYSKDTYSSYLEKSIENIDRKVEKLKKQREIVLDNLKALKLTDEFFEIKTINKICLKELNKRSYNEEYSIKDMFKDIIDKNIMNVLYKDLIYCFNNKSMITYFKVDKDEDIVLSNNEYLTFRCRIKRDSEIKGKIKKLINYINVNNINVNVDENVYMRIAPDAFLIVDSGYISNFFIKINSLPK